MNGLKQLFMLIVFINVSTIAQYIDDSDYDDYEAYDELLSHRQIRKNSIKQDDIVQDDFYIINEYDGTITENNEMDLILENDDGSIGMIKPPYQQLKWFKVPEKVYQYTKHRIPGYDYDELDFIGGKRFHKCDSRSVWSHCVCQFTCSNQNEVDCYMPCISGCECKEDFVFDENTQRCISPEMCQMPKNVHIKKK